MTFLVTFTPTGPGGGNPCTAQSSVFLTGVLGNQGGQPPSEGGGTSAGIIVGAIAGVGLLALLLLHHGHHKKGGDDGGGDEGGESKTPESKVKLPPGEVTAIRTQPNELVVRNREPQELRVWVQIDRKPHWYEVTDNPELRMKFQGGKARLQGESADGEHYLVERDAMAKDGMKVLVSFRGRDCVAPVSFYAP